MSRIKKVVIKEYGDESNLAIVEADLPDPSQGEVQLVVDYSIVSGSDVNMRNGTYPLQRKPPLTPGYSVLGTVRLNGKGCSKFQIGDRVACLSKYDGQAELINLPEQFLVPVPEGVDPKAAVSLVLDWVTAYQMLHHAAKVQSGQKIFVHGLSGAVGGALLSLGRIQGAQVFGTASSSRHEELRKLGAVPFDYSTKSWIAAMKELGGVDAVFDPLGYKSLTRFIQPTVADSRRRLAGPRCLGTPDAGPVVPGRARGPIGGAARVPRRVCERRGDRLLQGRVRRPGLHRIGRGDGSLHAPLQHADHRRWCGRLR